MSPKCIKRNKKKKAFPDQEDKMAVKVLYSSGHYSFNLKNFFSIPMNDSKCKWWRKLGLLEFKNYSDEILARKSDKRLEIKWKCAFIVDFCIYEA